VYNEAQGSGSAMVNARNAMSLHEVSLIHRGSKMSDHSPICIKCSGVYQTIVVNIMILKMLPAVKLM